MRAATTKPRTLNTAKNPESVCVVVEPLHLAVQPLKAAVDLRTLNLHQLEKSQNPLVPTPPILSLPQVTSKLEVGGLRDSCGLSSGATMNCAHSVVPWQQFVEACEDSKTQQQRDTNIHTKPRHDGSSSSSGVPAVPTVPLLTSSNRADHDALVVAYRDRHKPQRFNRAGNIRWPAGSVFRRSERRRGLCSRHEASTRSSSGGLVRF